VITSKYDDIFDDIFDLGVENEALRGKLGEVDDKWLSESNK
jgi:hypothetical protein